MSFVWHLLLLTLVACSPPPRPPPTQAVKDAPPRDAVSDAAPDAAPVTYTFPWQPLRDWYDSVVAGKTPCDYRRALRDDKVGTGECTPPVQMAAKVLLSKVVLDAQLRAEVSIDLGSDDGITKEWYAALIDDHGRLVTTWEHPDQVMLYRTFLTFRVKDQNAKLLKRAAFVKERP